MQLPFGLTSEALREIGITSFGVILTSEIAFSGEVRSYCEGNACRNYGATWACPPAVGTVEECRERVRRFERALVFASAYRLEDSFDFEGMAEGHRDFKAVCDRLYERCRGEFLLLSNEGCHPLRKVHLSRRALPVPGEAVSLAGGLRHFCQPSCEAGRRALQGRRKQCFLFRHAVL